MKNFKFILGVEKLINPINVGTLHFLQTFNEMLPVKMQTKIVEKSSEKNPLMGFVVEPYCYFLCYEIKDLNYFEKQIPDNFEIIKTKIFQLDEEKKYFILSCFNARTSGFFGSRVEAYVIARDKNTNLTSWVIIDYDTNTISYDSKNGLIHPTAKDGIITSNYEGEIIVKVESNDHSKQLIFNSNIKKGNFTPLDQKLWIEGNLSVAYGKKLSNNGDIFSLKFNPEEMMEALEIKPENLNITQNTWYANYLEKQPSKLVCFPYAQHFLSDSPGHSSNIQSEEELVKKIKTIDFDTINVYSTKSFKKFLFIFPTILNTIIVILFFLLIFTDI